MSTSLIVALVGVAGVVLGAVVGVYGQLALQRQQARREAEATLARYRDPLISAVVDLHWSIYNILHKAYLFRLVHNDEGGRREIAISSTLYNFAQYFGWREVLRRESQMLEFDQLESTRQVGKILTAITSRFAIDEPKGDESFRLFKAEQRGIGELMLTEARDRLLCVGFAQFERERKESIGGWLTKLEADLISLAPAETPTNERLREVQHLLADLAELLDTRSVRFPERLPRA